MQINPYEPPNPDLEGVYFTPSFFDYSLRAVWRSLRGTPLLARLNWFARHAVMRGLGQRPAATIGERRPRDAADVRIARPPAPIEAKLGPIVDWLTSEGFSLVCWARMKHIGYVQVYSAAFMDSLGSTAGIANAVVSLEADGMRCRESLYIRSATTSQRSLVTGALDAETTLPPSSSMASEYQLLPFGTSFDEIRRTHLNRIQGEELIRFTPETLDDHLIMRYQLNFDRIVASGAMLPLSPAEVERLSEIDVMNLHGWTIAW